MHMLSPLLAGNARTFLLAAISPKPEDYLETVNTLRLAARAQKIQVCPFDPIDLLAADCMCQTKQCFLILT